MLSNWFDESTLGGHWSSLLGRHVWCSEAAFIASKAVHFGSHDTASVILDTAAGEDAKAACDKIKTLGRKGIPGFNELEWKRVAFHMMLQAVTDKFEQRPELRRSLLDTGNRFIVESAHYDRVWGIGHPHCNMKGKCCDCHNDTRHDRTCPPCLL